VSSCRKRIVFHKLSGYAAVLLCTCAKFLGTQMCSAGTKTYRSIMDRTALSMFFVERGGMIDVLEGLWYLVRGCSRTASFGTLGKPSLVTLRMWTEVLVLCVGSDAAVRVRWFLAASPQGRDALRVGITCDQSVSSSAARPNDQAMELDNWVSEYTKFCLPRKKNV
jgi:hypothetical protein